jgi:hypothetical protein
MFSSSCSHGKVVTVKDGKINKEKYILLCYDRG